MIRKSILFGFCAVTSLLLQGCVGTLGSVAMQGLEGNGYCSPEVRQQAFQTHANLSYISQGAYVNNVLNEAGLPEERLRVVLKNKAVLDVWNYRTGHQDCRGLPTEEDYSPVVFQNKQVIGVGNKYYDRYVRRYVKHKVQLAGQKRQEGYDSFMYPFNKAF
ncbi:MAG: DUF3192 domain-containing protein [Alphaproteobacteria bacterium]|nr:DUF3192 domain-containing protein [Alphaproteobacteria bacterium]MDD9919100.1 DUF3192 domain-containing protein [Alphaproteobacteria bacterium]